MAAKSGRTPAAAKDKATKTETSKRAPKSAQRRDAVAGKGGGTLPREVAFDAIAERARKIAELTNEPRYAKHTADAEFQGWRLELGKIALGLQEAANRRDASGVEEGYAATTRVLSACHRKFPTSARQPGR